MLKLFLAFLTGLSAVSTAMGMYSPTPEDYRKYRAGTLGCVQEKLAKPDEGRDEV